MNFATRLLTDCGKGKAGYWFTNCRSYKKLSLLTNVYGDFSILWYTMVYNDKPFINAACEEIRKPPSPMLSQSGNADLILNMLAKLHPVIEKLVQLSFFWPRHNCDDADNYKCKGNRMDAINDIVECFNHWLHLPIMQKMMRLFR